MIKRFDLHDRRLHGNVERLRVGLGIRDDIQRDIAVIGGLQPHHRKGRFRERAGGRTLQDGPPDARLSVGERGRQTDLRTLGHGKRCCGFDETAAILHLEPRAGLEREAVRGDYRIVQIGTKATTPLDRDAAWCRHRSKQALASPVLAGVRKKRVFHNNAALVSGRIGEENRRPPRLCRAFAAEANARALRARQRSAYGQRAVRIPRLLRVEVERFG